MRYFSEKPMESTISTRRRSFVASPYGNGAQTAVLQRTALDFGAICALLFVILLATGTLTWQFWHVNRIYGGVTVANVAVGGLTRAEALRQITQQAQSYPPPALSLTLGEQQWPVRQEMLQAAPDLLAAVNQAYLVGRQRALPGRLGQQLVALLGGINIKPSITYNVEQLQQAVLAVADEARKPGQPAQQLGEVTIPAEPGILVDVGATTDALMTALQSEGASLIQLPLVVSEFMPQAPATASADPTTAAPQLFDTLGLGLTPLRLYDAQFDTEFALDPIVLSKLVRSREPLQLDESLLRDYLSGLAAQLDVAPRDARLRFNAATGGVTVIQESYSGRALDVEATITAIGEALRNGGKEAPLVMVAKPPAVDMNRIAEMGIRELVASGTSSFRGSSAARIHNIEVAAEKFDGLVIPPGEIFSFNTGVEDVTSANGFEDSLVIMGDTTAVGVGGGVCQVSTTIFRAAYNGGFPIVERYNHGYVVSWYGEPGLDATIYTPTVDFRFRNDTGAYLLIEPVVDSVSGVNTFNFYGTKPERAVTVGVPNRSAVIEPEPPTYVVNEALAPGERRQIEWEQKGMTVTVERTIVENGTTRTDTLTSVYSPWQAVYEVGPGTEIPATPTAAVSAGVLDPSIAITPTPSSPDSGP
jgi:vancomycin resistance protein YoaR